ncbi:MAG: hypothetical protein INR71_11100, partial [Terriglobus roseus]|nr:hypothetical protein [Terriglobus roseus]
YSDSEGSDSEDVKPTAKSNAASNPPVKPAFEKVVDRANPGKIRVNLPGAAAQGVSRDGDDTDGPTAKRAKTSGGFGGFNAMLPAPKKTNQPAASGLASTSKRGLGVGVNLKTGAQPAFSREVVHTSNSGGDEEPRQADRRNDAPQEHAFTRKEENITLVGKPTIFRPLSVANKKGKPRRTVAELSAAKVAPKSTPSTSQASTSSVPAERVATPPPKPRVSLFSYGAPAAEGPEPPPVVEEADAAETEAYDEADMGDEAPLVEPILTSESSGGATQITDIASSLNLTAAERRQLFGRRGMGDASAINIVNFNTDAEWAANEAARASGEAAAAAKQQQGHGVRAIAPGKHSLKQLVNSAVSQRDALEESFAAGRRNRKEAGNKYGW